jgi:hypothetical protein
VLFVQASLRPQSSYLGLPHGWDYRCAPHAQPPYDPSSSGKTGRTESSHSGSMRVPREQAPKHEHLLGLCVIVADI